MAEVTNTANWITSLIQVGVPSLVAIVSLAFTFLASRAGHKKDMRIAELTLQGKVRELTSQREATLVQDIAEAISAVENAVGKHSGIFRRNAYLNGAPVTQELDSSLRSAYAELSSAIDACCGARAKVSLLGKHNISHSFELFLEILFGFQREANPSLPADTIQLSETFEAVKTRRDELMKQLSSVYLHKD